MSDSAAPWTAAYQASLSPRVRSNSSPLSQRCRPAASSSVPPVSSRPQSEWRGGADQQPVQRAASSAVFLSLPPLGRGQLLPCHSLWNSCFLTAQKSGQKEKEFCDFYTVQVARLYSSSNLNMSILDSFLMA